MFLRTNITFWLFLANITMLAGTLSHFLDIDELKSIHYDIDIHEKPVLYGRPLHTEVVYLSSKFGQKYECQLPDVDDVGKVHEEEKTAAETGISDLLKPMELAPCLLKSKGWWTYEFCYGKHVRQFHMANNKISGEVITVGVFESEMDWENKSHSAAKRHRLNRYHSHRYVNGSTCDLTGKPREAEVRFLCAENELDTMSGIDEPESCRYVITVHTMRICHHPYLKPPAKAKPKTILCYPLLMPTQYEQYMHQQTKHRYSEEAQSQHSIEDKADEEEEITEEDGEGNLELLEEHHLHGNMFTSGSDMATSGNRDPSEKGIGPGELADVLSHVVNGVQGTIDKINSQLEDDASARQDGDSSASTAMGDVPSNDGDDDDDEEEEDDDEDDDELLELLKMDYKELTKYIKELPTGDREEAMELAKLAQEIESSFENIEAMEKMLDQINKDISDTKAINEALQKQLDTSDEVTESPVTVLESTLKDNFRREELMKDEVQDGEPVVDDDLGEDLKGDDASGGEGLMKKESKDQEEDEKEKKEDLELQLAETFNKLIRQLKEKVNFKGEMASSDSKESSGTNDLSSRVKVRITKIKLDKDQKASSEQELKFLDTDHQDIEEAISEQLEKSGLNKEGAGQLEVRILTYVPEEWPDQGTEDEGFAVLSEEDSSYFRNLIFGLVMREDGEVQSQQERLLKNYGFKWNGDLDHDQIQEQESKEQEEVQILIPRVGSKESRQGQSTTDPEQ